jgi:hypothetical protein
MGLVHEGSSDAALFHPGTPTRNTRFKMKRRSKHGSFGVSDTWPLFFSAAMISMTPNVFKGTGPRLDVLRNSPLLVLHCLTQGSAIQNFEASIYNERIVAATVGGIIP